MKRISLGTSDFKEIIDNDSYFVDKTLIVKEFLEDNGKIVLLPRPRRFGKTLNLSIIRYFLEKCSEDRAYLFKSSPAVLHINDFRRDKCLNDIYRGAGFEKVLTPTEVFLLGQVTSTYRRWGTYLLKCR